MDTKCRYCHEQASVIDGLCRCCWEILTELLIGKNTSPGFGDNCPQC